MSNSGKITETIKNNFSFLFLSIFWVFALLNPVFKKYDYGAGAPLIALFSVFLLAVALSEFSKKRERAFAEKFLLSIFATTYVAAFLFSQTFNLSLPETLAYLSVIPVYLFFAYKRIFWSMNFLKVVCVSTFLAVAFGFVQYFLMEPTRMAGPFFNVLYHANFWPNAFAMYLLMAWPAYLLVFRKNWKWSNILVLSFVLSALLLTFSRGALFAFSGQLVLLAIYRFRCISKKNIRIILITAILSLGFFFGATALRSIAFNTINLESRIKFENNEAITSGQERIDFWEGAYNLALEKPFFGWGPFSFRNAFNPDQKIFLGSSDHPHNIFLKFASENGILNMVAFFLFILTISIIAITRFSKLDEQKRDLVFILSVAVLGTFAHNLIDYNLNFFASLLLLFVYLALIRSALIIDDNKISRAFLGAILTCIVLLVVLYESSLFALSKLKIDLIDYSVYPRYTYLTRADTLLNEGKFEESLKAIEKQLSLNPLEAQAYYLRGVIFCSDSFQRRNLELCKKDFEQALYLNPMNDLIYYRDYLRVTQMLSSPEYEEHFQRCLELFHLYFGYVKYNVHFTSFTSQVEVAAEMVDMIIPHLDKAQALDLSFKKEMMLLYAKEHRGGKKVE